MEAFVFNKAVLDSNPNPELFTACFLLSLSLSTYEGH